MSAIKNSFSESNVGFTSFLKFTTFLTLKKKNLAFDTSRSITIMDAATEAAAWAAIKKNACAKRRLDDLQIMKMFTSKGLPEAWYLCAAALLTV